MKNRSIECLIASLGSQTRRRILVELGRKPSAANELACRLAMPASTVRHQLGLLRQCGLVAVRPSKSPQEYRLGRSMRVLFTEDSIVLHVEARDHGAFTLITPASEFDSAS